MIRFLKYLIEKHWEEYKLYRELRKRFPSCHFERNIDIKGPIEHLALGENVIMQSNIHLHLGGMEWCNYEGQLTIGKHSLISPGTLIYAAGPGVHIGDHFGCGPGVKIYSSSSVYSDKDLHHFDKVSIGNKVIIYSNAVISPGVTIGDHAVILAGAVVNKDVPANSIFGGIPAKFIKAKK